MVSDESHETVSSVRDRGWGLGTLGIGMGSSESHEWLRCRMRPKPGLEEIWGNIENTKEVEMEEITIEVGLIMVSLVG
jgi:hypothetical protein